MAAYGAAMAVAGLIARLQAAQNPPRYPVDHDPQPSDIYSPEYDEWFRRHYEVDEPEPGES